MQYQDNAIRGFYDIEIFFMRLYYVLDLEGLGIYAYVLIRVPIGGGSALYYNAAYLVLYWFRLIILILLKKILIFLMTL